MIDWILAYLLIALGILGVFWALGRDLDKHSEKPDEHADINRSWIDPMDYDND